MEQESSIRYAYYRSFSWTDSIFSSETTAVMIRLFCQIVLILVSIISDEDMQKNTTLQNLTEEWSDWMGIYIVMIILGFFGVQLLTATMSRQGNAFAFTMVIFLVYQTTLFVALFFHYIQGLTMKYGPQFGRQIYVTDKMEKEQLIFDDGTYIISNGKITGRQSFQ